MRTPSLSSPAYKSFISNLLEMLGLVDRGPRSHIKILSYLGLWVSGQVPLRPQQSWGTRGTKPGMTRFSDPSAILITPHA